MKSQEIIVTEEVFRIFEKYEGDFEQLFEKWGRKKDRDAITKEAVYVIEQYIQNQIFIQTNRLSIEMQQKIEQELAELEKSIDPEVVLEIKAKHVHSPS